ncbi:putative T7SS-secreted protein [Streptomyces shaanxiensis]|uniref:Putative T7SS secretion signal domain-containing protein n=1 Tax=Streptomyces shaanxiensis TaxID=653357 RepID=A0ABP7VG06_9ACTN
MAAELGDTKDPKELIPGDAGNLHEIARSLRKYSGSFENVGDGLGGVRISGWAGQASDNFSEKLDGEKKNWRYASDQMSGAASAISTYATALSEAQRQASEAIELWDGGDESQAELILKNARQCLRDEGDKAAEKLKELSGDSDNAPDWLASAAKTAENQQESGKSSYGKNVYEAQARDVQGKEHRTWGTPNGRSAEDLNAKPKAGHETKLWERSAEAEALKSEAEGESQWGVGKAAGKAGVQVLSAGGAVGASFADGRMQAGASASANLVAGSAEGSWEAGPYAVSGKASASIGAEASAKASVGKDGVHAGFDAFVGGKAGGEVHTDVAGIGIGGKAEVSYGLGGTATFDAGMKDGKFVIGGELGATVGVGGSVGGQVEIDPSKVVDSIGDAADAIGLDDVGDTVKEWNPFG